MVQFLLFLSLSSVVLTESRRQQQPQQPLETKFTINKGLYYSPVSREEEHDYYSKFGIYSTSNFDNKIKRHKIKSVAWTPENIKSLLICDDITALEDEQEEQYYGIHSIPTRSRKIPPISRLFKSNNIILNRISNRIQIASDKCRTILNHATDHSIGAKLYHDIKNKFLLHNKDNDDSVKIKNSLLEEEEREDFLKQADLLLHCVCNALEDDSIWSKLLDKDGVSVWRSNVDVKNYPSSLSSSNEVQDYATIRSEATMSASPKDVYELFMDNNRVHEYNDNCKELEDIEILCNNANLLAKINWSATGKMGPFAARDFVTLVTFKPLDDDSYVSLAVHVDHPKIAPIKNGYVRSQIQLAATFMYAVPGRPDLTRLVQVTQVGELGGVADSPLARKITSNLAEKAPVEFMKKFNNAVNRRGDKSNVPTLERKEA